MNLPCRRTCSIVFPTIRSGEPRITRAQRNSAARMRRPASRGASPRTMVSTSGSSGMLRDVDQNVVANYLNRKGSHLHGGIVIMSARATVEFPGVPWTGEILAVDCALSERPALMRARSGKRMDPSLDIADRVPLVAQRGLRDRA